MKHKLKSIFSSLSFQIFASFWLTFTILLGIALALPSFDARQFKEIDKESYLFFQKESERTAKKYNLDEIFERGLMLNTPAGFDIILQDRKSQMVKGVNDDQIQSLQAFMFKANDHLSPLKRRFEQTQIYGPFAVKTANRNYYQYFIQSVDPQKDILNLIFDSPWIMLLILLLISTPLLIWISLRIASPVKALRISADAVAAGDLTINKSLETNGIYELQTVGMSFNRMIKALQDLTTYQQRLLSDISHELKTPLTRIQLATSLIRRRNGESNELTRIENEIDKLNTMILDLLTLSRQQMNQHLTRDIFSLNKIWENVFEDARFEIENNNINFFVSQRVLHPEKTFINGNVSLLSSALENVIRNAKKYAKQNVKVMTYIDKSELVIIVDDDGPGVPASELENIFKPFYRVDEARARQTGGTGLGLAIVASATQHHQGNVTASESPMGGLRVTLTLPLWVE